MDVVLDRNIESIVLMSSSQIGKTEILNNILGYYISQDPCPVLVMQPTLEMARTWSKDRLNPMLRSSDVLKGKVKDVLVSKRLTDSPSCIVSDSTDPSAQMQKIFKQMGQTNMPESKPILEINPDHKIVKKLNKMSKTKQFSDSVLLLYEQALLAENIKLDDPNEFISRVNRALEKSL